ncbi:MAG: Serine acetyltransferase [candidate division BRC1 bacterium ADurb.Bin183]|nr:MAG: Serine acetyltransferase [candidate division BRC1 bacterium ADurb.Bin183]
MFNIIKEDIQNVFEKDPAARSRLEVLTCYPGLHAIWLHRIAHYFWKNGFRWLPRFISHCNRFLTGIEIHPGATIGRRFFIDHGMGVVIGETTEIGEDCTLYQGIVLGGTTLEKKKRHPTLGNNVTIGSGAIVLGAIILGDGCKIGAGSVIIRDVPPGATAIGVPGRIVGAEPPDHKQDLAHNKLPDPVAEAIRYWAVQQSKLEERIALLEDMLKESDANKDEKRK